MYCIRETNKSYTDKFNSKYTLVFSDWSTVRRSPDIDPGPVIIKIKLRNNETNDYIDLPLHIQLLLGPIIEETIYHKYFIEYKSREYIRIELAINLIKTMINF